ALVREELELAALERRVCPVPHHRHDYPRHGRQDVRQEPGVADLERPEDVMQQPVLRDAVDLQRLVLVGRITEAVQRENRKLVLRLLEDGRGRLELERALDDLTSGERSRDCRCVPGWT